MSVTVEVRGVPAGGAPSGGGGGSTGGTAGSGGNGFLPADDRLIADVRREMQSRGVLLVPGSQGLSQIISQYRKQLSDQASSGISQQFQSRREELIQRTQQEENEILEIENPVWRKNRLRQLTERTTREEEKLDSEEQAAKSRVETELTDAIKRLTDALERETENNPDQSESYIGRLRQQQKDLIKERDAAVNEEGAIAASKRLADVNERLRRVVTGEETGGRGGKEGGWGVALTGMRGMEQFAGAAESGNLAGMISGIGGAGVGIASAAGGLSMAGAATAMGVVALLAGIASGVQRGAERNTQMGNLAAFRSTTGLEGREGGAAIGPMIRDSRFAGNEIYNIGRLGLSEVEFSKEAEQRIRARGSSEDWFNEVYRQIGLERNFALRGGALSAAGAYDRYGINSTEAITRLVNSLAGIEGSGVTRGDFTRVQEKLDVQQQIMSSYMSRADRPDYDVANRTVAALSAVRGITQDARIGSDYAVMQNALQNPMNDRMKALVYGTIEDVIPGTRGRMDLIDQALRNPKNEGKILQSVIQRINAMYGGMDTQMGYFAFRSIFPGITPDRLKDYVRDFSDPNSEASKQLMGSLRGSAPVTYAGGERLSDRQVMIGTEYTNAVTQSLQQIQNGVQGIWDKMTQGNGTRSAQ